MTKKLTFDDVVAIVLECQCQPYVIDVRLHSSGEFYLQATHYRRCRDTGRFGWGKGGKYYVSPYSTPEEIRQKALAACIAYAEHEVRERFLWRGRAIFGPHLRHETLWEAAEDTVKRDEERVDVIT